MRRAGEKNVRPGGARLRRVGLIAAVATVALTAGVLATYPVLVRELGGAFDRSPGPISEALGPDARALVERAFEGVSRERLYDLHVHVAGIGTGGSGCAVHPDLLSWKKPVEHVRFDLYLSASGVDELERADQQYVERLTALLGREHAPRRSVLLAFDGHYGPDGLPVPERTVFHVPNEHVLGIVAARPDLFAAGVSIHPYRADALEELERCARAGARLVKWLPNAMGIDPASERCDAFYARMRELGMVLLSHTGHERAVPVAEHQEYGNPLRLRRPLDAGLTVVAAHCASLGESRDLDHPDAPPAPSFELFLRLMDEERYVGRLFGELSGVTLLNRAGRPLEVLLERGDLHHRLVNGSDHPLPSMKMLIQTRLFVARGMLSRAEAQLLDEVYDFDPLLFDFTLKRSLRHPRTGRGFDPEAFLIPREWGW